LRKADSLREQLEVGRKTAFLQLAIAWENQRRFRSENRADGDLIAGRPEVFVPNFREAGDQFFCRPAGNWAAGVYQVSPSVNSCPTLGHSFKGHPLCQSGSHGVVNPTYAAARYAAGYNVLDSR